MRRKRTITAPKADNQTGEPPRMQSEPREEKSYSAEFMLKEYERLNELSMATSNRSEQRVNFFLTVSSAVIGILILLGQQNPPNMRLPNETLVVTIEAVLIVLLAFGITTLNRVVSGRVQREVYYQPLMAHIQHYFAARDPQIATYLEIQKKEAEEPKYRFRLISGILKRHRGTLTDFMVLSNSLLGGSIVIVALSAAGQPLGTIIIAAIVTVAGLWLVFYRYYEYIRKKLPPFSF